MNQLEGKEEILNITTQDITNLLEMLQQERLPNVLHPMDVERILRISHYTCGELMKRNDFPSIKIGRRYKIPRDVFF
ncbi:hypothetical protein SAMN05444392_11674 [Seinonella peptonophila]|uniref:DNA binding domain-containing protein, excisionase family n=1 Tax=Seinonella peptonophila TaxID=112248 RepID=A0A1M5AZ60_9BACL|nr:DNA-binding protein [Seinonella peptonophila]SHF35212.1 hypothetical protein SAMN05444392_11674 [Seinonella peptonophila]